MIASPALPRATPLGRAAILTGIAALFVALLITWPRFAPREVLPNGDGHADQRHGGERFPPEAIRACIAAMLLPFEYTNGDKIAFLCRLADNRWGVQIIGAASRREITTFYGTLARMKNILARDGYTSVVPLP